LIDDVKLIFLININILFFIGIAFIGISYFLNDIYTLMKYYSSNDFDLVFIIKNLKLLLKTFIIKKKVLDIPHLFTISFYNLWKLASIFNVKKNCCCYGIKFVGTI